MRSTVFFTLASMARSVLDDVDELRRFSPAFCHRRARLSTRRVDFAARFVKG